ncbi:MAG: ribonuclease HII [Deltaproteobacteria bacterium]|nr:ribonuclease HII [Deltaproteobacteria bacterium]
MPLFPKSPTPSAVDILLYESAARKAGYRLIAGVDEAGRGPLAGPVVAAAVILPEGVALKGIRDSKQMTERSRERAFTMIHERAVAVGVGVVSHRVIDATNILRAALEAMRRAVLALDPAPQFCLVDGIHPIPLSIGQRSLKKGDRLSQSVSAASIIAKVYRDRLMCAYHEQYPGYGFAEHKGYGTPRHLEALRRLGACPIHRLTFRGVI